MPNKPMQLTIALLAFGSGGRKTSPNPLDGRKADVCGAASPSSGVRKEGDTASNAV
jgi:hypothetical protein